MMNEMSLQRLLEELCCKMVLLSFLWWSSEGMILAASYPAIKGSESESYSSSNSDAASNLDYQTPSLESLPSSRTSVASTSAIYPMPISSYLDVSEHLSHSVGNLEDAAFTLSLFLNDSMFENDNKTLFYVLNSTDVMPSLAEYSQRISSDPQSLVTEVQSVNIISHFHTPLMSLLVAPTSPSQVTPLASTKASQPLTTTTSSNNEVSASSHFPVPTESYNNNNKKLLMLVLKAEDCTKFSKSDFERMLAKLMKKFGITDAVPEVSTAKCYSHLSLNLTVDGPNPTLRFLPNVDGKNNFTVDVLNRTFRIIKFEKVDLRFERTRPRNVSSSVIEAVKEGVTRGYIYFGVFFGSVAVAMIFFACKFYFHRKSEKRLGIHSRLRPEDYTLTPIPRPNSVYVDYCRASNRADIFSTASAANPATEQGVIQPFDTSIVPLEDSSNLSESRDPSVESVPAQSDLKTLNVQNFSGKVLRASTTASREKQLLEKPHSKKVGFSTSGVTNPTFQRY